MVISAVLPICPKTTSLILFAQQFILVMPRMAFMLGWWSPWRLSGFFWLERIKTSRSPVQLWRFGAQWWSSMVVVSWHQGILKAEGSRMEMGDVCHQWPLNKCRRWDLKTIKWHADFFQKVFQHVMWWLSHSKPYFRFPHCLCMFMVGTSRSSLETS